ncbi:Uncharacterized protein HZ326_20285 [Fusarium oxysporum f. sp. albedinis]|nr:Uncharacterized protein HZ326_20285 [Fusarium oxysporum f. sp. albedinis]
MGSMSQAAENLFSVGILAKIPSQRRAVMFSASDGVCGLREQWKVETNRHKLNLSIYMRNAKLMLIDREM